MEDAEFNLYSNEQKLACKANVIINTWYRGVNSKEQEKKKHELFHLLVLLDIVEHFDCFTDYKQIRPNELGDAIIIDEKDNFNIDGENYIINDLDIYLESLNASLLWEII